jgi:hypothetical protein
VNISEMDQECVTHQLRGFVLPWVRKTRSQKHLWPEENSDL